VLSHRLASVLAALLALTPLAPAHPSTRPVLTPAAQVSALPHLGSLLEGGDVSWPNCPKGMGIPGRHGYGLPLPTRTARFVVLGATNGPAFTRNPCLRSQLTWARQRHLWVAAYAVVHYPTATELRRYGGRGGVARRLYRVGAAEARHALLTLHRAGLRTPMVWVDVETVGGHRWSTRPSMNNALLAGVLSTYRRAHVRTGIYSYAHAWNKIAGGKRMPHDTWVPSGTNQRAKALARCSQRSFSGGKVLLGQWSDGKRDYDVTCPGTTRSMRSLFAAT